MKPRAITFSRPLIHPIQEDRKTQTRRLPRPTALQWLQDFDPEFVAMPENHLCPYGYPGDLLWVREDAWMFCERIPNGKTPTGRPKWRFVPLREAPIHYAADQAEKPTIGVVHPETGNSWGWRLKVGRYLPQWASRIHLEVVRVRVERLQDVTEEDARAEGFSSCSYMFPEEQLGPVKGLDMRWARRRFASIWEKIHDLGSWDANPWVWVVEFRRLKPGDLAQRMVQSLEKFAKSTPFDAISLSAASASLAFSTLSTLSDEASQ